MARAMMKATTKTELPTTPAPAVAPAKRAKTAPATATPAAKAVKTAAAPKATTGTRAASKIAAKAVLAAVPTTKARKATKSAKAAPVTAPAPKKSTAPKLTAADRTEIEAILLEDRARALRSVKNQHETLADERSGTGRSGDVVDQSSDLALREMATVQASRDSSAVRAIDDALARLRVTPETFGVCTGCQGNIAAGRLMIMPTATRCVSCARG